MAAVGDVSGLCGEVDGDVCDGRERERERESDGEGEREGGRKRKRMEMEGEKERQQRTPTQQRKVWTVMWSSNDVDSV